MDNVLSYRIGYVSQPALPLKRVAELDIHYLEIIKKPGETADEVLQLLEPHGLRVATVHVHPTPLDDDETLWQTMTEAVAYAIRLDAKGFFVSMHAGERPRSEIYALLRRLGELMADYGLFMALETHRDLCENGDKAAETLAAVDHPAVGWNLDTANIYYYNEGVDVVAEARKAARFVRSVHAKDSPGGYHDPNFPLLGAGVVDFAGVAAVLKEAGFGGPWTLELEGLAAQADNEEQLAANVAACANHLRRLGIVS